MSKIDLIGIEYLKIVDEIYGAYLDATMGFGLGVQQIENGQKRMKNLGYSQKVMDEKRIFFSSANSIDEFIASNKVIHRTTQGEYKIRNSKNGRNFQIIGNLCLVQIYQYWDDHYRKAMAKELCIDASDIKDDIFGDLRILRNSIIHHKSIALKDVELKCKVFKWFKEGEIIFIRENHFYEIIPNIQQALLQIVNNLNIKFGL